MSDANCKVLIVDDSLMMRTILQDLVEALGSCEVIGTAENGKEALELVKQKRPDLILLDIEMPVMNGIEFLKRMHLVSKAKVIVVSYMTNDSLVKKEMLKNYGANYVINKPSGSLSLNLQEESSGVEIINAIRSSIKEIKNGKD